MLPPEFGGRWGISSEEMKKRPGYRPDRTADVARAKELLAAAGVTPGEVRVEILTRGGPENEPVERDLAGLGFKAEITLLDAAAVSDTTVWAEQLSPKRVGPLFSLDRIQEFLRPLHFIIPVPHHRGFAFPLPEHTVDD